MAYTPTTDFLALLRNTGGGVRTERMPGLDFVVAALARANLFKIWVGQTPPTSNQPTTVWFLPATPSWTAEGVPFLWNSATAAYEPATPALWTQLLSASAPSYVFQSVAGAADVVRSSTTMLAVQRDAPAATALTLPTLISRTGATPLHIIDWSSNVAAHVVNLTTPDGATIMRQAAWSLYSTPDQLGGVTLYPSSDLNGWVIA